MRKVLHQRMTETRDMGLIPEPILEDVGREAGNKYTSLFSTTTIAGKRCA